tara:strand:- start:537 stop:959 length:423 start_codon:yes stop_codon:yes gene_type:complete
MIDKNYNLTKFFFIIFFLVLSQVLANYVIGIEPDEILSDKKQEIRAREISKNIRCLVCQNQSIDDSNAPLAKDLRILIRNEIRDGKKDEEIYKFLTDRYGDFILLKPPFKLSTIALWLLPFVFFVMGIYILYSHNKESKK